MRSGGRRKSIAFFIILGAALVGGAVALNVGWIIISWREAGLLLAGLLVFPVIITGLVINTIFLVREIRRNEQHEAFINAVTHELKTPVASLKLYLQTLQTRQVDETKRQAFYRSMVEDSDRLLGTIEQVLRAGELGAKAHRTNRVAIDLSAIVQESLSLARARYRLLPEALVYREASMGAGRRVLGDEDTAWSTTRSGPGRTSRGKWGWSRWTRPGRSCAFAIAAWGSLRPSASGSSDASTAFRAP
jgi:signal transduction histidine kinase